MTFWGVGISAAVAVGTSVYSGVASSNAASSMGKTRKEAETELSGIRATGFGALSNDRASRMSSESVLGQLEGYLGTDEQLSGTWAGQSGGVTPYLQRYQVDQSIINAGGRAFKQWARDQGYKDNSAGAAGNIVGKANDLLDSAEQYARAGDFSTADSLRQQAASYINSRSPSGSGSQAWMQAVQLRGGSEYESQTARDIAGSPSGQIVGGMLRDARQLMDPNSDAYNRFYESLTAGPTAEIKAGIIKGERATAAEARGITQAQSEREAQLGGIRDPYAAQSMNQRAFDAEAGQNANLELTGATEIAKIQSQSTQWLETFKRTYAENAVGFARAWAEGSPGIRKEFQDSLSHLADMTAQFTSSLSGQQVDIVKANQAIEAAQGQLMPNLMASMSGSLLGVAGQLAGGFMKTQSNTGGGSTLTTGGAADVNTSGSIAMLQSIAQLGSMSFA